MTDASQQSQMDAKAVRRAARRDRYGAFTTAHAIEAMWNACEVTAPQDLIEWLSDGLGDEASRQLRNLSEVVAGVGCLVMSDGNGDSLVSGNFQEGDSVGTLLFTISDQIATLGAVVSIASQAEYWRRIPQEERAKLGGWR